MRCLDGLRVVELSQFLPGPFAAQMLSDLGAEVLKIEPPAGDPLRALGPMDRDGLSAFYKLVNAGKTVATLDLKTQAGRDSAAGLIARADVLIESFRPGKLAALGLGQARLASDNPGLIHCTITNYGQTGPYAQRVGHDINAMALTGGLAGSGTAERPVLANPPTSDYASALQAVIAILGAVIRRGRDGQGATLDISLSESVLAWQAWQLTAARRGKTPPGRARSLLDGGAACYQIYRTADGRYVTLGALEAKFWQAFCIAVGRPDWAERQQEPLPQEALIAEVAALFESAPLSHWTALLDQVECCFQAIVEPAELADHPQILARGLVTVGATVDPLVQVAFPAWIDGEPPAPRAALRLASSEALVGLWRDQKSEPVKWKSKSGNIY
ncbi:MAG: CoA transferase [Pseudomonadota bacterium]